ncbi:hypothetical protein N037_14985 [Enterobacter sp. EGD-HP1]|nr:hypothetical protein N037_14985 [Enterobacter sp. EGD-HP1]
MFTGIHMIQLNFCTFYIIAIAFDDIAIKFLAYRHTCTLSY